MTEWTRLAALSQQTGFADATAFLHARRADQDSEVRLVVVEVTYLPTMCFGPKAMFEARVFDPAAGLGKLKEMNATGNKWLHDVQSFYEPGERVKILGGRPDPADSAHFTIEYLREPGSPNERAGTIDGWLTSDDRVVLEIRGKSLHRRDRRAVR